MFFMTKTFCSITLWNTEPRVRQSAKQTVELLPAVLPHIKSRITCKCIHMSYILAWSNFDLFPLWRNALQIHFQGILSFSFLCILEKSGHLISTYNMSFWVKVSIHFPEICWDRILVIDLELFWDDQSGSWKGISLQGNFLWQGCIASFSKSNLLRYRIVRFFLAGREAGRLRHSKLSTLCNST